MLQDTGSNVLATYMAKLSDCPDVIRVIQEVTFWYYIYSINQMSLEYARKVLLCKLFYSCPKWNDCNILQEL